MGFLNQKQTRTKISKGKEALARLSQGLNKSAFVGGGTKARQADDSIRGVGGQAGLDIIKALNQPQKDLFAAQDRLGKGGIGAGTITRNSKGEPIAGEQTKIQLGGKTEIPKMKAAKKAFERLYRNGTPKMPKGALPERLGIFGRKNPNARPPPILDAIVKGKVAEAPKERAKFKEVIKLTKERDAEAKVQASLARPSSFNIDALNAAIMNKTRRRRGAGEGPNAAGLLGNAKGRKVL